jgi:methylated-DNA-[protein]-cysteine S-methyltransferase
MEYFDIVVAPWGNIFVIFNSRGITRICLSSDQFRWEFGETLAQKKHQNVRKEFREYFKRKRKRFTLSLLISGTKFQTKVWDALLNIPYGQIRSYGWIAERVGTPRGGRAVGNAVGANPIPIIVPCHRVIRGDGTLGGYYYGPEIKRQLLKIEGLGY